MQVVKEPICRRLKTDAEILASFPLMRQLRPHAVQDESAYLRAIRKQEEEGYELHAAFMDEIMVAAAGIRLQRTLSRGPHLFVDDLVTDAARAGRGIGRLLVAYLESIADREGLSRIYLDSRDSACGFYEKLGFRFLTSRPCFLELKGQ